MVNVNKKLWKQSKIYNFVLRQIILLCTVINITRKVKRSLPLVEKGDTFKFTYVFKVEGE